LSSAEEPPEHPMREYDIAPTKARRPSVDALIMPASGSFAKPPGGACRTVPRPRANSSSTSCLKRVGAVSGAKAAPRAASLSSEAAQVGRNPPAKLVDVAATPVRNATPVRSARSAPDVLQVSRRPASGSGKAKQVSLPPPPEEDDGVRTGKLNADGAALPPWSCTFHKKIRYQPTTLIWKVHEIPKGMQKAVASLDARRYQPTSADHGLDFRLRHAVPGGPLWESASLERLGKNCLEGRAPPREGMASPRVHKWDAPLWWGCGPPLTDDAKLSSSYDDLGLAGQRIGIGKEQTLSKSVPSLDGRFTHDNPFMSQFAFRTPGGGIVYDVSVNAKAGCCARDPNCPKPKSRGF